jgi:hypothetical protein
MPRYDRQSHYRQDWPEYDPDHHNEGGYSTEVLDPLALTTEQQSHLLAAILDRLGLEFVSGDLFDEPRLALRERKTSK